MSLTFVPLTLDQLKTNWPEFQKTLKAPHPFITPGWLDTWWGSFGGSDELFLRAVKRDNETLGIVPLRVNGGVARFIGSADVCDYLDFLVKPGAEPEYFEAVLNSVKSYGIKTLELESLRPDSTALNFLVPAAKMGDNSVEVVDTDVTLEMTLPATWDSYLLSLPTHQRHETSRKLRRLEEAGAVRFDIKPSENVDEGMATLLRLLRISRSDKAQFMTENMETFFRRLASAMDQAGLLRIGQLWLKDAIVASIMCFDYNGTRYLYNSGYAPEFSSLSVGLLSKVYSIKNAIEQKMVSYDFLKGAEVYKYHLGGIEMPISRLRIELN